MDKKDRQEFNTLRVEVRRLEQVVSLLLRRVNQLEKRNKSLTARIQQTGADVATVDHNLKRSGGPYNPRGGF